MLRAELYLRVMPHRGMPPRGSFQDRVAQEMLLRERRRVLLGNVYQAQLVAAGLRIDQALFDAWTMVYEGEVLHDNYRPDMVAQKKDMLEKLQEGRRAQVALQHKPRQYEITSVDQLKPYSKEELAAIKAKLRRREIQRSQKGYLG